MSDGTLSIMQISLKRPPTGFRLFLFRLTRRTLARLEPRDPTYLARRLEHGEIVWSAFVDAGSALVQTGRFEEADRMLERGLAAFPDDRTLLFEHALCAHNSGRYTDAITRWENALRVAPDVAMCHFGLAANLRETGDIEAAATCIAEASRLFSDDVGVISEAARIAEADGDFREALGLWERAVARRNPHPDWLRGHAHALVLLGRFDEAEVALTAALAKHPDEKVLLAVEGILASARQDWPTSIALWTAYRRRFPEDGTGWTHYGHAVQASMLSESIDRDLPIPDQDAAGRPAPLKVELVEDEGLRHLLLGFESIGDNCEFGSVQRRYSAEPLGLLRWNDVALDDLLSALDRRFDGMGEAENTELPVLDNGEYIVRDRRWSLWMHTFLFVGQVDRDALYPKMCRRVAYLRDKFLADLVAAEKIFVFRSEGLDGERLQTLHHALLTFGPIKLLSVQPSASMTEFHGDAGDIIKVDDKRFVGFLGRLGVAEGNYWDIAFDDWVSVCRKVHEAV